MRFLSRRSTVLALVALAQLACGTSNPYQGMTEEQLFLQGRSRYEAEDYDEAVRALDRFLLAFGSSALVPDARLLLGHSHFGNGDFITARGQYSTFLDRHRGHAESAVAALGICKSLAELSPHPQRDQTYTEDALLNCGNVVQDFGGTPQATEASAIADEMRSKLAQSEYLAADFYFRRRLFDSAITYFEFVVQAYPNTDWAPQALLGIYRANQAIGYDDLAQEARDQLLSQYPDSPAAASVRADAVGS
jgi:outer membrane protein assembly factor BamD